MLITATMKKAKGVSGEISWEKKITTFEKRERHILQPFYFGIINDEFDSWLCKKKKLSKASLQILYRPLPTHITPITSLIITSYLNRGCLSCMLYFSQ